MPKRPHDYPIPSVPATPSLRGILRDRIQRHGPLPFPEFMACALYEPGLGYYARGTRQVGRGGDFFTSVSVGPLFGELLARRFLRHWLESGKPDRWRILECGAHDGTLAADILTTIQALKPEAFAALEYAIPEPLLSLQAAQRKTLTPFPKQTRFAKNASELATDPLPGIAFGNEVLDALPFHIVERKAGGWLERRVNQTSNGEFIWEAAEIDNPSLTAALDCLGNAFPDGYTTEIRTNYSAFLAPLAQCLVSPTMFWPDYGFARADYYHPARNNGTLRTFSSHQSADNPLAAPGDTDITAHVDFTAVAESAATLGGKAIDFRNQGAWLTEIARDWLMAQEGNPAPAALRQFQTLTHPAHLGSSFHVLEISWDPSRGSENPAALQHRLFGN